MSYSHKAGTSGTITVPTDRHVLEYSFLDGSLTITPAGGVAQDAIVDDSGVGFGAQFSDAAGVASGLGPGSTLEFAATSRYFVRFI